MTMTTNLARGEGTPTRQAKRKGGTDTGLATVRVNHLLKLFRSRYEDGLPDDADGRAALTVLVKLAIHITQERAAKLAEIYGLAPWASMEMRDELERCAFAEKWWPSSIDELGAMFRVSREERHGLEAWQLGAIDESPEERAATEAEKHRDRERERRRQNRAARPAKPSAQDRADRLFEELPHTQVEIKVIVERVRHLPEFKSVKDVAGAVHKAADALKARGLLVDQEQRQGRRLIRMIRRARDSDRRIEVAAPKAATNVPQAQNAAGVEYLQRLKVELLNFTSKDEVHRLSQWFSGVAERTVRGRAGLTEEQMAEARGMLDARASDLLGREVRFQWTRSR